MKRISFANLPSLPALFLDYLRDAAPLREFYAQRHSLESIAAFALGRPVLGAAHRDRLCSSLSGDPESIRKLASGACAVITGQQPVLFTGPAYTILKTITVIKLAKDLEARGIPAAPVFWIAAEDHDYEEIQSVSVLDKDSAVRRVGIDLSNPGPSPVGWLELGADVSAACSELLLSLPDSEFQPWVLEIIESTYRAGASPVDAFGRMLARLFEGTGLVIANPLHPGLRELARPTLSEAVQRNAEIRAAVVQRSRNLSAAGYHEQVKVDEKFTGLFTYRGTSRQALRPEELQEDMPLSPNVLLRPLIQDAIFPTAAYVGGPAEIAYFAQAAPAYEVLGRSIPPIYPRISATLLEPRIERVLNKYGLDFQDVFCGRDAVRKKAVGTLQGIEAFAAVRERLSADIETLRPVLNAVDPTLLGALDNSRQKMLHQVEALETKFVNAESRRNETLERHLDSLMNSIYPGKQLQERVLNISSFLVRYGPSLMSRLMQELELDSREHQVVEI